MPIVNLTVSNELNDLRKSKGLTWQQVINAGLNQPTPTIDSELEEAFKQTFKHFTAAWNLVKKRTPP